MREVSSRWLSIAACLCVLGMLLLADFGAGPTDLFSRMDDDGRVDVFCTAVQGREGKSGMMLDVVDRQENTAKAFCPNGTYPAEMRFPCGVRISGRTSVDAAGIIFVERLEVLGRP